MCHYFRHYTRSLKGFFIMGVTLTLVANIKTNTSHQNVREDSGYISRLTTKPTKWPLRPAKTGGCMKKHWILSYTADAQADLSLRWAHRSACWFYHDAAHIGNCFGNIERKIFQTKNYVHILETTSFAELSIKVWQQMTLNEQFRREKEQANAELTLWYIPAIPHMLTSVA